MPCELGRVTAVDVLVAAVGGKDHRCAFRTSVRVSEHEPPQSRPAQVAEPVPLARVPLAFLERPHLVQGRGQVGEELVDERRRVGQHDDRGERHPERALAVGDAHRACRHLPHIQRRQLVRGVAEHGDVGAVVALAGHVDGAEHADTLLRPEPFQRALRVGSSPGRR